MSLFGRLFQWFAQDIVVKFLANNRSFQRFAVKMDASINNNKKVIEDKVKSVNKENIVNSASDFKTFLQDIQNEMKKIK